MEKFRKIFAKANRIRPHLDKCPSCLIHFNKKKTRVIFKEVVECTRCGYIWILRSKDEFERHCV